MAYLGKKKIQQISRISVFDEAIINNVKDSSWLDNPPECWDSSETEIFDIASEVEREVISKVLEILNGDTK